MDLTICPACGNNKWAGIPDSLAEHCHCGFVRVQTQHGWKEGATLQEWAEYLDSSLRKGVLWRTRCYLIGSMQYAHGAHWREVVRERLEPRKIICFDPYHKPFINDIKEDDEARAQMLTDMSKRNFTPVVERMKKVRSDDLRLCDLSDFFIAHIIPSVASWGSAEEITTANRMKKPMFLSIEGGITKTPLWLMGMVPHKYIYDSIEDVVRMIENIDDGSVPIDSDRWRLLRHEYR